MQVSLVRLCDSDFGIAPVDDITIGITCAAFCFHIAHISFASSWCLFCLSVIVLARLCVFGTAIIITIITISLRPYEDKHATLTADKTILNVARIDWASTC